MVVANHALNGRVEPTDFTRSDASAGARVAVTLGFPEIPAGCGKLKA
jgi:hypothetical protein